MNQSPAELQAQAEGTRRMEAELLGMIESQFGLIEHIRARLDAQRSTLHAMLDHWEALAVRISAIEAAQVSHELDA